MTEQLDLGLTPDDAAVISLCGRYRYELTRRWDHGPLLEFIMLNPSTADANADDPTIRRCLGFAKKWGYGSLVVRNLYAYRATDPIMLSWIEDPIGPENARYLARSDANCTIAAWGANPAAVGWWNGYPYAWQPHVLTANRPRMYCLGTNANGSPKHPLYVPSSRTPVPWKAP